MSILSSRPVVSIGEVLQPSDFNTLSAGGRAYLNDFALGAMMRLRQRDLGPPTTTAATLYSLGHSGGPRATGTNLRFGCNAGPLFYAPATPAVDGVTPKVQCYYLTTNEIAATLGTADPTNPRFDAVYVRLTEVDGALVTTSFEDATGVKTSQSMVTNRQVKLEQLVVAGTPNAKPQIPAAPDATWALWSVFWVPATFASIFAIQHIYDYRVPLHTYTRHFIGAPDLVAFTTANMTVDRWNGTGTMTGASEVAGKLRAHSGRVMGIGWSWLAHNAGDPFRIRINYHSSGTAFMDSPYRRSGYPNAAMSATGMDNLYLSGGLWYNSGGTLVTTSSDGYALLPIWANGYGCETEDPSNIGGGGSGSSTVETAVVVAGCSAAVGTTFFGVSFDVAGG
jgi:hypothetical protein